MVEIGNPETAVFNATTALIVDPTVVRVSLAVTAGITVERSIRLEGLHYPSAQVSGTNYDDAMHAMIVLLGGKKLIVHLGNEAAEAIKCEWSQTKCVLTVDCEDREKPAIGRVYLNAKVYDPPIPLSVPFGQDKPRINVSDYFIWLSEHNFDLSLVKALLNGKHNKLPRTDKASASRGRRHHVSGNR